MRQVWRIGFQRLGAALLLTALGCGSGSLLTGCGAARGLINSQIPAIQNPGNLEGKQFPVVVGASGATGEGTYTGPFSDQARVDQQDRLTFAQLRQELRPEVTVPLPDGVPASVLPAQVTVRDLSLSIMLREATDQNATPTREVVFPVLEDGVPTYTFTRVGDTNRYTVAGNEPILLGPVRVSGDEARRLFSLLTDPAQDSSTTNFVRATLSVTVDGITLPQGTALVFTFGSGEARVGI